MEHSDLIGEMTYIEKLSTQERLKLARRRRVQQLKRWSQREKEASSKQEKTAQNEAQKRMNTRKKASRRVFFDSHVMLLEAAARNDIEEVQSLLERKVNPDSTNEDGLTALHQCCIDDSEDMMRLLVEFGANVNAKDSEKWTPLHAAATCGHLHLAKFLIENNANLLAVNADGNMPYDICEDDATLDYIEGEMAARGVTQQLIDDTRATVERLMLDDLKNMKKEGMSLMYRDEHGATPLHIASANGYTTVVEYLLSQNVPTEVRDYDDWSPLHASACWGHPDVLELLVQHGTSLQSRTKNQETPYDICEDPELRDRISQLINEQESKRHDQSKKVRRGRSNKRTQSIRRTSIREKTLTPKKEAMEEGRMRLHLENTIPPDNCLPDVCPTTKSIENNKEYALDNREITENGFDEINDGDKPENFSEMITSIDDLHDEDTLTLEKPKGNPPPIPPPRSSSVKDYKVQSVDTPKIDIHVTVTVNPFSPGTLSDLKKQRALTRASQNYTLTGPSSVFEPPESDDVTEDTPKINPPPSPDPPKRYYGEPADFPDKSTGWVCCNLM